MAYSFRPILFVIGASLVFAPCVTASQWPTNPGANLPLAVALYANESPKSVSDDQGGAIIAWEYIGAATAALDVFVQRIDAAGNSVWSANGLAATSAPEYQLGISIVRDGTGGAIIAWQDYRSGSNSDIYVQRIDPGGNLLWSVDGVPICTAANDQIEVKLIGLGQGGAIAVWRDMRADGVTADVFAQRVSPTGSVLWTLDGTPVCTSLADETQLDVTSSSGGNTVVVWRDSRNIGTTSEDIFAQRLTALGTATWPANGITVCSATRRQENPEVIEGSDGGVIVVWGDRRNVPTASDVYAQGVDSLGIAAWGADGIPVCAVAGSQLRPQMISDGSHGAIVCWPDDRGGSSIYAQRLGSGGLAAWTIDGVPVCDASGTSDSPKIIQDQSGGAVITWEDTRNSPSSMDVYAQRLDDNGSPLWVTNGVAVSTATDSQHKLAAVSDGHNGLTVAWEDWRDGGYIAQSYDIYVQHVNFDGSLGGPTAVTPVARAPRLRILATTPNPFSSHVVVGFDTDVSGDVEIRIYSVAGHLVFQDTAHASRGTNQYLHRDRDIAGRQLPSGVYFLRLRSGRASAVTKLVIAR